MSDLRIVYIGFIALLGLACTQSQNFDDGGKEPPPDEDVEFRTYINEHGEINLRQLNDTLWQTVFINNKGESFDTTMAIVKSDSLDPALGLGVPQEDFFLKFGWGGLSVGKNKLVVLEFSSIARIQMHTGIQQIYNRAFFRSDQKVTVEGEFCHGGGYNLEKIEDVYMDMHDTHYIPLAYYQATGKISKESYEDSFGKTHYKLIMSNPDLKEPEPSVYKGHTVAIANGEIALAWEYADSEAFILEGWKIQNRHDIGKKITVKGYLVQNSKGSFLKNWEIIDGH